MGLKALKGKFTQGAPPRGGHPPEIAPQATEERAEDVAPRATEEHAQDVAPQAPEEHAEAGEPLETAAGDPLALPRGVRKVLPQHVAEGEEPDYAIVGDFGQALVGFGDRALIIKPGYMAGSSFGARVTSFPYGEIVAVEVNTAMIKAVLELVTAGHEGGRTKDYWSSDPDRDPAKISSCLPLSKRGLRTQQPALDTLRDRVKEARERRNSPATSAGATDLPEQLARLAQLRDQGILSEEEFAQAKRRLLVG